MILFCPRFWNTAYLWGLNYNLLCLFVLSISKWSFNTSSVGYVLVIICMQQDNGNFYLTVWKYVIIQNIKTNVNISWYCLYSEDSLYWKTGYLTNHLVFFCFLRIILPVFCIPRIMLLKCHFCVLIQQIFENLLYAKAL